MLHNSFTPKSSQVKSLHWTDKSHLISQNCLRNKPKRKATKKIGLRSTKCRPLFGMDFWMIICKHVRNIMVSWKERIAVPSFVLFGSPDLFPPSRHTKRPISHNCAAASSPSAVAAAGVAAIGTVEAVEASGRSGPLNDNFDKAIDD